MEFWELLVFPCAQPLISESRIAYRHKTAVGEGFVLFNGDSIVRDSGFKAVTVILLRPTLIHLPY
jgi:hypothetical protein